MLNYISVLIENGYSVIPVDKKGNYLVDPKLEYTVFDAISWEERFGETDISLVCRDGLSVVRFDIGDEECSSVLFDNVMAEFKSQCICRYGENNFLCIFKDKDFDGIENIKSILYRTNDSKECRISYTCNGIERISGPGYKWGKYNPSNVNSSDLDILTHGMFSEILSWLNTLMSGKATVIEPKIINSVKTIEKNNILFTDREYTKEEIDVILTSCDGTNRQTWLDVGYSLHCFYKGNKQGLDIWDDWSNKYPQYAGRNDIEYHWSLFKDSSYMTYGILSSSNKTDHEDENNKIYEDIVKNLIFIKTKSMVGDLRQRSDISVSRLSEVRNLYANTTVQQRTITNRIKHVPVITKWLKDERRKSVISIEYMPGKPRIFSINGTNELYYNIYSKPYIRHVGDRRNKVAPFVDHLEYLAGNFGSKFIINWLAQIVQEPHKRYRVTPLLISVFEGTGRGWLTTLISELVGISNFRTVVDISDIVATNKDSGYIRNSIVCVVNEVYVPRKIRFTMMSKLKTILSDDIQEVKSKRFHLYNKKIYTRFLLQSNHINGLAIDKGNTRIQPIINYDKPMPKEYYFDLFSLLDDKEFIGQVHAWLMGVRINRKHLVNTTNTKDMTSVVNAQFS